MTNVILSIIGYLRRKSLEGHAWKATPQKGFFPHVMTDLKHEISVLLFLLRFSHSVFHYTHAAHVTY